MPLLVQPQHGQCADDAAVELVVLQWVTKHGQPIYDAGLLGGPLALFGGGSAFVDGLLPCGVETLQPRALGRCPSVPRPDPLDWRCAICIAISGPIPASTSATISPQRAEKRVLVVDGASFPSIDGFHAARPTCSAMLMRNASRIIRLVGAGECDLPIATVYRILELVDALVELGFGAGGPYQPHNAVRAEPT